MIDAYGTAIARRAAEHLGSAGRRSYELGDTAGAVNLLSRALDLTDPESADRVRLGLELSRSLAWAGQEERAFELAEEANRTATRVGNQALQMQATLAVTEFRAWRVPSAWVEWRTTAEHAIEVFGPSGDRSVLARAWAMLAWYHIVRNRFGECDRAAERALVYARAAGDRRLELDILSLLGSTVWGALPVTEALDRCERLSLQAGGNRSLEAMLMAHRASLLAMTGDFEEARRLYAHGKAITDELGRPTESAFAVQEGWYIEMLAREYGQAEGLTRAEYERLLATDSRSLLDVTRDMLALAICAQGRFDEAEALAIETEQTPLTADDVTGQNVWRRVRARAFSARGEHAEAVRLAREAEALFEGTDALIDHGEALLDLAFVLHAAGRVDEAAPVASDGLALYERKGNLVEAARARAFIDELRR